jgi:hypothetical protein
LIETIVTEFPMMRIVLDQRHGSIRAGCWGEALLFPVSRNLFSKVENLSSRIGSNNE